MTKFLGCIEDGAKTGEIDAETAAAARATYEDAYEAASATLGPDEADRAAGRAVMTDLEARAVRAKQLRALTVRSRRTILEGIAEMKRQRGYSGVEALGGKGAKPPKDGWVQGGEPPKKGPGSEGAIAARSLELLIENKPGLAGGPFASVEGRSRAILGQFHAMMADLIETFETKTGLDAPNRAVMENVVREAFGRDTGDAAAKGLAQAWADTAEHARLQFNAAGGAIGKRDDWGLPQWHDPVAVRRAGREGWVEAVLPRLAREKMTDKVTGMPFTEKRLRAVLGETWERIATGGLVDRTPNEHFGRGQLANQRGEERFLIFRDPEQWMAYNAEFGRGDPFGIMMGHLSEMANDIGQMQILGPNPHAQFEWLKRFAEREASVELAAGVKGASRAKTYLRQASNMYDHVTGAANVPEREWVADLGASVRAYNTGAVLGSAIISDMPSSPVFGAMARTFSGLSKVGDIGRLGEMIASPSGRAMARRSGFVVEQALDGIQHGAQDSLRLATVGNRLDGQGLNAFSRRLPAAVFRVTGLTGWTAARKRTFRFEFLGALADRREMTLADMAKGDGEDQAFAALLHARGFGEPEWALIRSSPVWSPREGADFLRPREIIDHAGEDLGLRVAEMIEMQTRQAVPETTIWTRAKLLGQDKPGTFKGEFSRSWAMFRSFTLTSTHIYAEDIFLRAMRSASPTGYLTAMTAGLVGALTVAGAAAIQIRQTVQGNDPRDMTDARFWGAALMQGGGIGLVGDFLYSGQSRAGKSSAMTGWGPAAALASDAWSLTGGNVIDVATNLSAGDDVGKAVKKAAPGRDAAMFAGRYNPASSIWWARAAIDRDIIDQLQRLVDPEAEKSFRARTKNLERTYGQQQWWREGALAPERAPDLSAALGPTD